LKEHDPVMAEDAMHDHLSFSLKNVERYLQKQQDPSSF
jgi:DNA-binding GntR family transcriptional regulator